MIGWVGSGKNFRELDWVGFKKWTHVQLWYTLSVDERILTMRPYSRGTERDVVYIVTVGTPVLSATTRHENKVAR